MRLALTLFTALRLVPPDARADRRLLGRAVLLAPAVGLLLGIAGAAVVKLGRLAWGDREDFLVAALAGLVTIAALSAGRTWAGLVATTDRLAVDTQRAAPGRDLALTARRGQATGVGASAAAFSILGQTAALQICVVFHRGTLAIVVGAVASRLAMVLMCTSGPRAGTVGRPENALAGSVSRPAAALVCLAVVVATGLAGRFDIDGGRVRLAGQAVLALAAGILAAALLRWWCRRRFDGFTEPMLGAVAEVTMLVVILVLAMRVPDVVTFV